MDKDLITLKIEIENLRKELDDILRNRNDMVVNELTAEVSEKLDRLIVQYMKKY